MVSDGNGNYGIVFVDECSRGSVKELVVRVDVPRYIPPNRQHMPGQRNLNQEPQIFIDSLVRDLPGTAIKPIHLNTPELKIVGSPDHGYILTVKLEYHAELMSIIHGLTR